MGKPRMAADDDLVIVGSLTVITFVLLLIGMSM